MHTHLCLPILSILLISGQQEASAQATRVSPNLTPQALNQPPRVLDAQRFLARRGLKPGASSALSLLRSHVGHTAIPASAPPSQTTATWQPVGPTAVLTPAFGLVTGRVSALALDPSDPTGNRLYLGTTGGGVWTAQNSAVSNPAQVVFTPLTDTLEALGGVLDVSISIGALAVQPGGTGVILAGTGDPNDALDSYYGSGILRSADGGNSWSLISGTADNVFSFTGEGFAGFAWSSLNPQIVVAAVSQAFEGTLVNALVVGRSYEGLYYSSDGGVTWTLATMTDGPNEVVQGPGSAFALPDGNAATSVVWNPVRQLFVAAVRFHGYYESTDGMTFTRMPDQPAISLDPLSCPTNSRQSGSIDCPIFRGTLAVNPQTGDTFAWTVDLYNQDLGLWQDQCAIANGSCANQNITFSQQWNTQALETNTPEGSATIVNGDYNLALAAVPAALGQGEDTWLLAGDNDLWKCSLAMGCVWRNTTNATTCMSAQVAPFQHALAWSPINPLEIFAGNDSGLWRSLDAIGETGSVCAPTDATHFQNMNGSLGSLAEVESLAVNNNSQYIMMAGLGVNGTAGLKSATAATAVWPQILSGNGGPVAIDPGNIENWYVNSQNGVSIYLCSALGSCSPASFGTSPVVDDADVEGDGNTMPSSAPFLVDPLDTTQLLIGTCRLWRGPADGSAWSGANAISPILDSGALGVSCSGDALIRSMAAQPPNSDTEVIYVGMYGSLSGGETLPGHIFSATIDPQSTAMPVWTDLTLNPVTNSDKPFNIYGLDISSIFIDPHDPTGETVYVTIEGPGNNKVSAQTVYGSTDGGLHWGGFTANLLGVPVSSIVVDPQNAGTVYLATDVGVYFTTQVASCANLPSYCWTKFGTGLPEAPVEQLSASQVTASAQVLTAGTYGRGIWQTALCSASGSGQTSASTSDIQLSFGSQAVLTASSPRIVAVTNTGTVALTVTSIAMTDSVDFSETDDCTSASVAPGSACTVNVTFKPQAVGVLAGEMAIYSNVCGGQVAVNLTGTGTSTSVVTLSTSTLAFGDVPVGTAYPPLGLPVGVNTPVPITGVAITPPFTILSNACVPSPPLPGTCQVEVQFTPAASGLASGTLTFTDQAGTQTAILTGTGQAPPTDILNPLSVSFPSTAVGQLSTPLPVLLTNTGDLPLTSIAVSVSTAFQTGGDCGTQLPGHSVCTVQVVFAPTQIGIQPGLLTISDAQRTQTVSLSGTGVQPATLVVSPVSLTFAVQNVGVAGTPDLLTITNSGGASAANVGFQITGPSAVNFATGTTTCTAVLTGGASCTVQVIFSPTSAGGSAATLVISSATFGVSSISVPLNGTGQVASGLNVNPAQLAFAAITVGSSSRAQTVTVSNTSNIAASQLALSVTPGFSIVQNTCASSLTAGSTCTVGVVFSPTVSGPATGAFNAASPSIATSATVPLSGTGAVAAGIAVTPPAIDFPTTGVGQTSSPATITITNTGALTALSSLAFTVPSGFQLVNNTCAATLAPGSTCTTGVEFAPATAGAQTGKLSVTSPTVASSPFVTLQGMGYDFTLAISGPNTQSVASGQSASYTVELTPLSGSSGSFTFGCGTLPSKAVCSFNPTAETVNAGATGDVKVNISTGSATTSTRSRGPRIWDALPLLCAFILLPLGWKSRRRLLRVTALFFLSGVCFILSSCGTVSGGIGGGGGSGGGSGGSGSTPSGTYPIQVNATSNGVQHSITVTLTVD
ncbi:MAG: choice-of-anchor D domain-containing protein [Terracidiphilus sp.]